MLLLNYLNKKLDLMDRDISINGTNLIRVGVHCIQV